MVVVNHPDLSFPCRCIPENSAEGFGAIPVPEKEHSWAGEQTHLCELIWRVPLWAFRTLQLNVQPKPALAGESSASGASMDSMLIRGVCL